MTASRLICAPIGGSANFDKRITEINRKVEAERKERLEKEESLSDAIADISSNVAEVDKRIDVNEGDISLLKEKQSDLLAKPWLRAGSFVRPLAAPPPKIFPELAHVSLLIVATRWRSYEKKQKACGFLICKK